MLLDLNTIKAITLGAARITAEEDGFYFCRFTKTEEELYKARSESSYLRTFATSGVQFAFKTNSKMLCIKGEAKQFGSRSYYGMDIFVNGEIVDSINNVGEVQLPSNYAEEKYPLGEFEKHISLGEGEKTVKIYFPFTVKTIIKEISLDDGATIIPIKPKHKLLAYGDSITHGYDAINPSSKYITKLAEYLDAEEINKAIGGEIFWPKLVENKLDFNPDIITVAYGSNDWNLSTPQEFTQNVKEFFTNLKSNYKNTPIFAITPIWRKDCDKDVPFGEFKKLEEIIREVATEVGGITVIAGFDLVEHNENLFGDLRLHPSDEGFDQYFKNLVKQLKESFAL